MFKWMRWLYSLLVKPNKKDVDPNGYKRWRQGVAEAKDICERMGHKEPCEPLVPSTPDCLKTYEIDEFNRGNKLPKERVDHIKQCRRCSVLLPEALSDE